jgi:uncharacterized membrane protein
MRLLNSAMTCTLFGGPEKFYWRLFYNALIPLCIFVCIYIICLYFKKWISQEHRFAVAFRSGYIFLIVGILYPTRSIIYRINEYGLDMFMKSVMYTCALGLSFVCFRLRSKDNRDNSRTKMMYLLMLVAIVLLITRIYTLCT